MMTRWTRGAGEPGHKGTKEAVIEMVTWWTGEPGEERRERGSGEEPWGGHERKDGMVEWNKKRLRGRG